jgi:hypothetical protein
MGEGGEVATGKGEYRKGCSVLGIAERGERRNAIEIDHRKGNTTAGIGEREGEKSYKNRRILRRSALRIGKYGWDEGYRNKRVLRRRIATRATEHGC